MFFSRRGRVDRFAVPPVEDGRMNAVEIGVDGSMEFGTVDASGPVMEGEMVVSRPIFINGRPASLWFDAGALLEEDPAYNYLAMFLAHRFEVSIKDFHLMVGKCIITGFDAADAAPAGLWPRSWAAIELKAKQEYYGREAYWMRVFTMKNALHFGIPLRAA